MTAGAAQRPGVELNAAQRAAIERWGQDVCVVAGPGSGKTRVLIERFRWLVEVKGISPRRILAVTFTEKAATEIKKRLIDTFALSDRLREEMERAWVSTIHGFCTRLLKENAIAAGVDPEFQLLDEAQSQILERRTAETVLDAMLAERPPQMRELLKELDVGGSDLAGGLLDLYAEARTAGVRVDQITAQATPANTGWAAITGSARVILTDPVNGTPNQRKVHQQLHQWARDVLTLRESAGWRDHILLLDRVPKPHSLKIGTRARSEVQELADTIVPQVAATLTLQQRAGVYPLCLEALRRIDAQYRATKRELSMLDFEDLQEFTIRLLESNAPLREKIRDHFDQVLMDELQDTNRLQWRLVDLVRKPDALFAVGDINQSIYYFRHADPGVFREYRDALANRGCQIDELRENYRSRQEIISAVNAIVPFLPGGVEPHRLEAKREYPIKWDLSVEMVHSFEQNVNEPASEIEARWIARRIREMEGSMTIGKPGSERAVRFSDIAVLARTIAALGDVQRALDAFGVPSTISGGRGFYEAREIRDLMAWLAVLANPRDEISLATVLRSPLVGINDEALFRLKQSEGTLFSVIAASKEDDRLTWFHDLVVRQRSQADVVGPDMLLSQVLDESSYEQGLPSRARANIAKFLAVLRQRFHRQPCTLGELTDLLAQWRDTESEAEASAEEVTNSVRLLSVHAAKGLEFPVVFVAAMRNGAQNREPIFCFGEGLHLGASWRHPEIGPGISDPVHLRTCARKKRQEAAEEDRLLYVAMTRAEEHLVFTAAPGGKGTWATHVAEGLGIASGVPKQEMNADTGRVKVIHTSQMPKNDFPTLAAAGAEEIELFDPPVVPDLHESVVPVTSVAQHAFCPRQYFLARFLGVEAAARIPAEDQTTVDRGEFTASEFGVIVHELLAGKTHDEAPQEAHELASRFEHSVLGQRLKRATRSGREYDFLIELEGMILRGQIDVWFEENAELVLVDYKSDQVEAGKERWHARRYGPQLRLYALALERLTGRLPDRAVLWYLRNGVQVDVSLLPIAMADCRTQVKQLKEAQSNLLFPLREGDHCVRCAFYQNACPSQFKQAADLPNSGV